LTRRLSTVSAERLLRKRFDVSRGTSCLGKKLQSALCSTANWLYRRTAVRGSESPPANEMT
jgi:hypothetical protein